MGKKSKKQKKSKKSKKHSSSSSSSVDSKAGEGEKFCALIFFLACIGLFITAKQVEKAVAINVDLANHARSACNELDWAAFNTDPASFAGDNCYYWQSDFRISYDVGDAQLDVPIFDFAYQGRALRFNREIYQYQQWEVEHCESKKRNGQAVNDTFVLWQKDNWSAEDNQKYADFKTGVQEGRSECYTEIHTGWSTQNHWYNHDAGVYHNFDFPGAGQADSASGHRSIHVTRDATVLIESGTDTTPDGQDFDVYTYKTTNPVLHYDFEYNKDDVAKGACNGVVWGIAGREGRKYLDFVEGMGQTEFYSDPVRENNRLTATGHHLSHWEGEVEVSKKSLCVRQNADSDNWVLQDTTDFVNHVGYGDPAYYPDCRDSAGEIQLGDYLFNAYNEGHQHDSNFVVASIRKGDDDKYTVEPYRNMAYDDTSEALPTFLFLYKDHEEGKEFNQHIDEHINWLREAGGAAQGFLYFCAAIAFLISGSCTEAAKKAAKKGSGSS